MNQNPEDFNPIDEINQLNFENQQLRNKTNELTGALTSSGFNGQDEQNLIITQLETDKILERIEHFLKGDQIKFGENGAYYSEPTKSVLALTKKDTKTGITYYIQEIKEPKKGTELLKEILVKIENKDGDALNVLEQDSKRILEKMNKLKLQDLGYKYIQILDEDKKPLNEYGIAELMRIISMYVEKETFLSYYSEERINEILGDLGDALNNFLYCNYEKMGMDTKFKESRYAIIILNILHLIESCYRRALGGAEQENLRTRAIVTQNQGIGGNAPNITPHQLNKKKWHPLKPDTW